MATVSPTPAPAGPTRRTSQRQALRRPPSRISAARADSVPPVAEIPNPAAPVSMTASRHAQSQQSQSQQQKYNDDSSEDEIPVPMKLSALTKALLNDGAPENAGPGDGAGRAAQASPPRTRRQASNLNTSTSSATERRRNLRSGSAQPEDVGNSSKVQSPDEEKEQGPAKKRVVRLSHTPQSLNQIGPSKRRSTSTTTSTSRSSQNPVQQPSRPASRTGSRDKSADEAPEPQPSVNTPNQAGRVVRIAVGSSGNRSRIGSVAPSSGRSFSERSGADKLGAEAEAEEYDDEAVARDMPPISMGSIARYPSTSNRNRQDENGNPQSSMRIKRVGKLPGSFLSGPARRGRRRQSEEDGEEHGDADGLIPGQELVGYSADDHAASSFYGDANRGFNSGSPLSGNAAARASHRRQASNVDIHNSVRRSASFQEKPAPEQAPMSPPKPAVFRPELPSAHDQENEVPASYKRTKPSVDQILEKIPHRPLSEDIHIGRTASPERKPLSSITQNTPRRAAPPPPPKMSVLDTVTSTAGAATTAQKARRNVIKLNGKVYTRLDCLGRGGSAKVYRVTAENGNMFALKRVSLENADEITIRGFRGEIDLLGKLSGVDRVIKLYDSEMNEEKKMLTLLMEMGELDLNTLMRTRQSPEVSKFDPVFVRLYWKEMLECLQAVHQYDIVHSDLKPANFVLVKGRLKLIDFGIANAIQTDQTVNVHRETQIGTPNYMSPESLMDSNNPRGGRAAGRPKLMKLGKPSDVWSLGCILYQMVYGVPPFGHIPNPMARCQAIINWDHTIEFPSRGMGGVSVPPSLLRTMKRCLIREQHMRPTCEELLHETDPFLYPVEVGEKALPIDEEMLARIIQSVVTRCKERMPTEAESMSVWPQAYWASVRKAMAGRR